jgi:homoserine dehydrogenase
LALPAGPALKPRRGWHNQSVTVTKSLRVALLGLGTVGSAVAARLLDEEWRRSIAARGLTPPELVAVGVREPGRQRALDLPNWVDRTDELRSVVARIDVDVVIELIGGLEPAHELVAKALGARKSVVTANKFLLAERGPELEAIARRTGAALRFEAAVAGGVPILAPLARDLSANRIDRVRGIVNGTTNFILSAMAEEGRSYADVLADAQARGYAEADPSADVEGRDAVNKLVLLARVAFGVWVQPSGVARTGITDVTAEDVSVAARAGYAIKLVASVERVVSDAGSQLIGFVEPCAVARASVMGRAHGVTNVVEVSGSPIGRVIFQGPGAGGDATSSAVLGDLLALARDEGSTWATLPKAPPLGELNDGRSNARRRRTYRRLED